VEGRSDWDVWGEETGDLEEKEFGGVGSEREEGRVLPGFSPVDGEGTRKRKGRGREEGGKRDGAACTALPGIIIPDPVSLR
jgi:hypothetical protein